MHEVGQPVRVASELHPCRIVDLQHVFVCSWVPTSRRSSGWPGGVRPGPPASLFAKCSAQMSLYQSSFLTTFFQGVSPLYPHHFKSSPSFLSFFLPSFLSSFFPKPAACRSSQARDQTCTTAVTRAIAMITQDPLTSSPPGNSHPGFSSSYSLPPAVIQPPICVLSISLHWIGSSCLNRALLYSRHLEYCLAQSRHSMCLLNESMNEQTEPQRESPCSLLCPLWGSQGSPGDGS